MPAIEELVARRRAIPAVSYLLGALHDLERHLVWVRATSPEGAQTLACMRALDRAITEVTGPP